MIDPAPNRTAASGGVGTPEITLAGRDWPIPDLLTWRELSRCRRALLELNGLITDAVAAAGLLGDDSDGARIARNLQALSTVFRDLADADFDRLVMTPIYVALTARHPALTREEFDAWPTTEIERQYAILAVRRYSGLFVFADPASDPEEAAPGEDDGEP